MTPTAFAHELSHLRDRVWTTTEYLVFLDMARLHMEDDLEAEYDKGFEDGQRDAEDK